MNSYTFLAKRPETLRFGADIYRVNAGQVLTLSESRGKQVVEGRVPKADALMLVSINPDPKAIKVEKSVEASEPVVEVKSEDSTSEEAEVTKSTEPFPLTPDSHWQTVKGFLEEYEEAGDMEEETLLKVKAMFPTYSSVQTEVNRLLETL